MMDNSIVVNSFLASHGGTCTIANNSCCTWINKAVGGTGYTLLYGESYLAF